MRSEPGDTWGDSAPTGQRLQEPALLGMPMYEAHRQVLLQSRFLFLDAAQMVGMLGVAINAFLMLV